MRMVEDQTLARHIITALKDEYDQEKPLPHVTELITCLTKSYYNRKSPLPSTDREILFFARGWGLERLLLQNQKRRNEGSIAGIHYSPDFLSPLNIPAELKTTMMSRKMIDSKGLPITWQRQILAYMKATESNVYELVVFSLTTPEIISFKIYAEQEEIDDNWQWLLQRKEEYMQCLESNTVPTPVESFECKECRYYVRCKGGL